MNDRHKKIELLLLICAVALTLRLTFAFAAPNIAHPDQIFQNLEQAHRLVYGYGIVPWEFREGVRSWILPGVFALVFKVSDTLLRVPGAYLIGSTVFLSLLSLSPIVCGFLWAWRLDGERAAVITAGFAAVWFELVYFAPAALTEVIATHILLAGLFLAFPGEVVLSRLRLIAAGLPLGFALMLRIQLLPAFVVIAIYAWRMRRRQSTSYLAIGFAGACLAAGLLDWITWSYPWQSIWKYFYINMVEHRSYSFGTFPWYRYVIEFAVFWSAAFLPMLCLIWLGARRMPLLGTLAVVIVASHSIIGHKEYRFIYSAIAMLIILAGIGSSILLSKFNLNSWFMVPACLVIVTSASIVLAVEKNYHPFLTASRGEIIAFRHIASDPRACGVVLWHQRGWTTPGYTGLHRNIPIYEALPVGNPREFLSSGNYLVARMPVDVPGDFMLRQYFGGDFPVYLYHRQGGCSQQHLSERLLYPDWYGDPKQNTK